MTYVTSRVEALHRGLTPLDPNDDRIGFAPKLQGDIRVLAAAGVLSPDESYLTLNKHYTFEDISGHAWLNDNQSLIDTIWVVSDIEGWWNIADAEIPNIERGFGDGSFDVSGRFLAREITITGSIIMSKTSRTSIAEASIAARKILLQAFNLVKRGTWMIVDEDNFKRAAFVRLSGRPDVSVVNTRGRIDFSIGLRAGDPIKYEWIDDTAENVPAGESVLGNGYNVSRAQPGFTGASAESRVSDYQPEYGYRVGDQDGAGAGTESELGYYRGYLEHGYRVGESALEYFRQYDAQSLIVRDIDAYIAVENHGTSNVYCYFRILGPFFGPAFIRNVTTDQTMRFVSPTFQTGNQILGPSPVTAATEFLDINTHTREVHKGYFDGATPIEETGSSRGLLEPLVDWIYLAPGSNTIHFQDAGLATSNSLSAPILQVYWRSGWDG
jgi:hypothetical protein